MRASYSVLTRRRVVAVCAGLTAVYLAVLSGQRALDGYRARQEVVVAAHEIDTLRAQNLSLQADLNTALGDSEIERLARNELGLVKPGDKPVVLIWPDGAPPASSLDAGIRTAPGPRWKAWLRLFFDTD